MIQYFIRTVRQKADWQGIYARRPRPTKKLAEMNECTFQVYLIIYNNLKKINDAEKMVCLLAERQQLSRPHLYTN
jgi:hypothetical protein